MKQPKLIAEAGCNHQGDLLLAKKMIDAAVQYGRVDYVKFQKREVKELLSEKEYLSPHPEPKQSFGENYGKHREFLEFTLDQHAELKSYCEKLGTGYACSVWDVSSALKIISLNPDYIKVPSACNLDFNLLGNIAEEFQGEIHISLGMTTREECRQIIAFLEKKKALSRSVLYSCISAYPVPAEHVCLFDLKYLVENYGESAAAIGFSGHHEGVLLDIAAYSLGASWVERHFTLDKKWKGTDQSLSLSPSELRELKDNLALVASALSYKSDSVMPIELAQREKLKRRASGGNLHV